MRRKMEWAGSLAIRKNWLGLGDRYRRNYQVTVWRPGRLVYEPETKEVFVYGQVGKVVPVQMEGTDLYAPGEWLLRLNLFDGLEPVYVYVNLVQGEPKVLMEDVQRGFRVGDVVRAYLPEEGEVLNDDLMLMPTVLAMDEMAD